MAESHRSWSEIYSPSEALKSAIGKNRQILRGLFGVRIDPSPPLSANRDPGENYLHGTGLPTGRSLGAAFMHAVGKISLQGEGAQESDDAILNARCAATTLALRMARPTNRSLFADTL